MNAKAITFGILKAIGILLGGVILIWLLIKIKALILYIGIASFIALLCRPMVLFLQEKLKFHRTLSSLTTLLVVMLAIVGLLYIFVPIIVQQSKNISEIDFVKIDLEGHELPALKGWKNSLRNRVLRAIYIEIMPENQRRYNLNTKAPLEYLESFGYELYLCKDEDFGFFGENPKKYEMISKTLILSRFKSTEFPDDFATDVLAIASQKD